ncbi:hypothetical protein Pmar_PMAR023596 [Perkinsus marinus ATCC 50983]|uniref:Uncharacterized protein n=1 Tax=Perkinsus marinus (strain ATCC 50983 / TXsc) TaxID=423536 RepID=C5KCS6_PERM5|nr:hypothetical protein Pmar_PMAR023596 [Perkinsus marinus ATCC 50983]EER17675.1 hypothetical protein Pmar_PMAR023596 [Perkinsus marinus ATCC 50983]|eukprot:XP_002785879.1 hypothetical protein Pmar_PMAR023596 [Perkinsus marinus ATCC 50983]
MPTAIVTEPDVWSRARQFLPRLESSTTEDKGNLLASSAEVLRSLLEADEHSSSRLVEIINIQKARIASLQASLEGGRSETATLRQQPDGLIQELRSELTKSREEVLSLRERIKRIKELKEEEERFGLDIIREMVAEVEGGSSHDINADDCLLTARLFTRQRFLLVTALKVAHELREDNVKLSLQLSSVRSRLERLGGEAAIKALSSAVEARDRRIAEKDAKIAELGARLEAARREAIEQISNTSMASSTISERTNLEASDTEKALLVDTQETNLSVASSVPCRDPVRQYDVDGNKV